MAGNRQKEGKAAEMATTVAHTMALLEQVAKAVVVEAAVAEDITEALPESNKAALAVGRVRAVHLSFPA